MKDFFKILGRFIPPYMGNLRLSILFNLLGALFGGIATILMLPVLNVLFDTTKEVHSVMDWELTMAVVKNNLFYFVTQVKQEYGIVAIIPILGLVMLSATFLKVGFTYLASYNTVAIRNGVSRDIRIQIFEKLMSLPMGYFSEEKKGDVMSRATGDVVEVETSVLASINVFFKNPIIILVSVAYMLFMSVKLTLIVFVMLPFAGWIIGRTGRSLKKKSHKAQSKIGEILGILEESLGGLRIIKAFNAEHRMTELYGGESQKYRKIMNSVQRKKALAHPLSEFLGTIVMVCVVWVGVLVINVGDGAMEGTDFVVYLAFFYQIIPPSKAFSTGFFNIQKGSAAMERIDKILLADNKILEQDGDKRILNLEQSIVYKDVAFAYGENEVLKNISVEIPKGKMVALVGQSGSGKTTFVDLLPRFYDVKSGQILIDGQDIRDLKIQDLRGLMGNVNQEAILFNDTFFNNIAFGKEGATQEEVENAARVANAHEFIMESEEGYQARIGDRGGKLSGGQRQRISIARAILKNPSILILDEATSALDTESEKLVQEALENLMKSRTSIVIAHRLSTVRNADMICVFSEGEIVEKGSHDELLQKEGIYKKLHELQVR